MELLIILHPENEIGGNIISTGHTAVFWHSPQHYMDSVSKIIYFITSWNFVEYGGMLWNFLRILHPGNKTCANFLPVWHTAIFLHIPCIPQDSMGFEPKIPYLQRIWYTKVPIHFTGRTIRYLQPINKLTFQCACEIRTLWTELTTNNTGLLFDMLSSQLVLVASLIGRPYDFIGQYWFDTVLILIGTLYSTCIWLFLSVIRQMNESTLIHIIGNISANYSPIWKIQNLAYSGLRARSDERDRDVARDATREIAWRAR